jgi:hypothetical protein
MAQMPDDSGLGFTPVLQLYSPLAGPFQLSLVLRERFDGSIAGGLEFDASRFDPATAAGLDERLHRMLEAAVREPGRRLSSLGAVEVAD